MSEPYIKLKIGSSDEFSLTDKIGGLRYLGQDTASSSPQFTNTYQDLSGVDGSFFVAQSFAKRSIAEKFWLHFNSYQDFILAKQELYHIFGTRQPVRVRTDTYPLIVYYGYVTAFDIAPLANGSHDANFSITFDVPDGYRYSLYASDELADAHKDDGWEFGMNLPENVLPAYKVSGNSFRIYNASDIAVDPYYQKHTLKITMSYSGSSMTLTNTTNGTSWSYKQSTNGKQLVLDGLNAYLDSTNANANSDYGSIRLEPGWNDFTVDGAGGFNATFSFPFIYIS